MLYKTKPALASKTVISSLIVVLASIASMFGYSVSPDDQSVLGGLVFSVITALGGIGAIYGRVTAKEVIRGTVPGGTEE